MSNLEPDEWRRSSIKVVVGSNEVRHVPDSPELRALLAHMELGCKVLGMRKRSFLFFKRKLNPQEKAIELLKLQMEEPAIA